VVIIQLSTQVVAQTLVVIEKMRKPCGQILEIFTGFVFVSRRFFRHHLKAVTAGEW
jgi:hypothetical protein